MSTQEIASHANLDPTQKEALSHALSRRVSLIQGPPGTGKTYVGALVANAIVKRTKETILVVCYTNHALVRCVRICSCPPEGKCECSGENCEGSKCTKCDGEERLMGAGDQPVLPVHTRMLVGPLCFLAPSLPPTGSVLGVVAREGHH